MLLEELRTRLQEATFFAISADCSTAVGNKEYLELDVYMSQNGARECFFGMLVNTWARATACRCAPAVPTTCNPLSRCMPAAQAHASQCCPPPLFAAAALLSRTHAQVEVGERTNARGQVDLITAVLMRDLGLTKVEIARKLVATVFDGASVYQGSHAGVSVLMQVRWWLRPQAGGGGLCGRGGGGVGGVQRSRRTAQHGAAQHRTSAPPAS